MDMECILPVTIQQSKITYKIWYVHEFYDKTKPPFLEQMHAE